jgi:hypothetical protein
MDDKESYIENSVDGRKASVSAWKFDDDDYPVSWNVSYLSSSDSEIVTTAEFVQKFEHTDDIVDEQNLHRHR